MTSQAQCLIAELSDGGIVRAGLEDSLIVA
jgi:hypothetical protein